MKLSKMLNERTQKGQECVELCEQQAFKFCANLCSFLWSFTDSMWAWKSDRFLWISQSTFKCIRPYWAVFSCSYCFFYLTKISFKFSQYFVMSFSLILVNFTLTKMQSNLTKNHLAVNLPSEIIMRSLFWNSAMNSLGFSYSLAVFQCFIMGSEYS